MSRSRVVRKQVKSWAPFVPDKPGFVAEENALLFFGSAYKRVPTSFGKCREINVPRRPILRATGDLALSSGGYQ
jgi:hypothetical protein